MVNKISEDLDSPVDLALSNIVDMDLNFYKKLGLSPNGLTTISLILGLLASYNLYYDNYFLAGLLLFISYYFDVADGKMARKYKMVSKFGDLYDHYSDFAKFIILFGVLYKKLSLSQFIKISIVTGILLILCNIFLSCQEEIYGKKEESGFLNFFNIDLENCEKKIKYFKYFGPGTLMLFLSICLIFWNKLIKLIN
jgi:phosphatidylglycerophosphate synthase